jgi:hypothetical protein
VDPLLIKVLSGKTKVYHVDFIFILGFGQTQDDVLGLDVSMHEPTRMQIIKPINLFLDVKL